MKMLQLIRSLTVRRNAFASIDKISQRRTCVTFTKGKQNEPNVISSPYDDCQLHSKTVVQHFFDQASLWPHVTATECGITGRKYTYDQIRMFSRRFGSCLSRIGCKKGETLALILPNIPEFPIALLGAAGIGMPVTMVNPSYTPEEIAYQMNNSDTCVVVTIPQLAESVRQAAKSCPSLRRFIAIGDTQEGFVNFREMLQDPGDLFDDNLDINIQEDTFILPYSSGTTGLPKGVILTHSNVSANIEQSYHRGIFKGSFPTDTYQDVLPSILPFFHVYGLVTIMLAGLKHGTRLVTLPSFHPTTFIKTLYSNPPTMLYLVPPLISFLGHVPDLKLEAFHRMHSLLSGAAPLGATDYHKILDRLKIPNLTVQEGYGLTEASPLTHATPRINRKVVSIGEPISRTQAKIVDLDTGKSLGPREEGELCIFGPQVMKGYYKNPKATEETIDSSGWLHTGDIGYYDEDGQFCIVERLKDLIKVKGLQVAPSELENVLRNHPIVLDVAVIGVPDQETGERPHAIIVQKPGQTTSEQDIKEFLQSKVAPHKYLKSIVFTDNIPKSNTGKVLRKELRKTYS